MILLLLAGIAVSGLKEERKMNPYKMIIYLLMGYVPLVSYSSDSLMINEFMASNISCQLNPENSDFEDWIELYNSSSTAIELGGLFLTDDLSDPFKWQLPGDARIQPGSYFIVWADGAGADNHATFKLSADGEEIGLFYPDGRVIDTVTYGVQRNDISFGRFPDGGSNWQYFSKPSFSSSNNVPGLSSGSQAARPGFSPEGGLFSGPQTITLHSNPGTTICFTTDGAAPTLASSKYIEPIIVESGL